MGLHLHCRGWRGGKLCVSWLHAGFLRGGLKSAAKVSTNLLPSSPVNSTFCFHSLQDTAPPKQGKLTLALLKIGDALCSPEKCSGWTTSPPPPHTHTPLGWVTGRHAIFRESANITTPIITRNCSKHAICKIYYNTLRTCWVARTC